MKQQFELNNFLPFRLNMLAQETSQRLSVIYAERFGLDIPQWRILANLASRGSMTAQEIVVLTLSHKSTISRAVAELAARKLVERTTTDSDKRALALRLTAPGKKLFQELVPLVLAFEKNLIKQLNKTELQGLLTGLAALEQSLRPVKREVK